MKTFNEEKVTLCEEELKMAVLEALGLLNDFNSQVDFYSDEGRCCVEVTIRMDGPAYDGPISKRPVKKGMKSKVTIKEGGWQQPDSPVKEFQQEGKEDGKEK